MTKEITIIVKEDGKLDQTLVKVVDLQTADKLEVFIVEHLGGRPTGKRK